VGLWVLAFAVTAVAALAGGTAHGFRLYLGEANGSLVWTVTVWSIGAGAVLLLLAGLRAALRPETHDQKDRKTGVSLLKKGIVVSAVGIVLMVSRVSLHPHFNQNDLYHVVQMVGLYCFYKGGVLLHGLN
jgi:Ca2+/Na+ antiporter